MPYSRELIVAVLVVWCIAVAAVDWRQRRIPNWLLLIVLGPAALSFLVFGRGVLEASLASSLFGAVVCFCLLLPGYLSSKLGAGDVKLAAVCGFVLGLDAGLRGMLFAALLLGGMSLFAVARFGRQHARNLRLPAGLALGGGFIAMLLYRWDGL